MKSLWLFLRRALLLALAAGCSDWPLGQDAEHGPVVSFDEEVSGEIAGRDAVFRVMGERGRKMRVLFQGMSGQESDLLQLAVEGEITGYALATVASHGNATSLAGQASQWFVFPASMPYLIRVRGTSPGAGGAFRFRVQSPDYPLELSDTIHGEIMRVPGDVDVDEHRFYASAGQQIALILRVWENWSPVRVELYRGADLVTTLSQAALIDGVQHPEAFRLDVAEAGEYRIRIAGVDEVWMLEPRTGAYQLEVLEIDSSPEVVSPGVTLGSVVMHEAIDHPGDIDEFRIVASAGDEFNLVMLNGPWGQSGISHDEYGFPRSGLDWSPIIRVLDGAGRTVSLAARATPRIVADEGGEYIVRIQDPHPQSNFQGSYALAFHRIDRSPEGVDPVLPTGEWVSGEIDQVGDIDSFVYRASPGQAIAVFGRKEGWVDLEMLLPDGSLAVPTSARYGCAARHACGGALQFVPESGEYQISVVGSDDELRSWLGLGPYEVLVNAIDPKPEMVGPVLTIDEPMVGESYYPAGDVDEFELVSPDHDARLFFVLDGPPPLALEVLVAGTDSVIAEDRQDYSAGSTWAPARTHMRVRVFAAPVQWPGLIPSEPIPYRIDVLCWTPEVTPRSCTVTPPLE